jgi:tetratricopeptide (TPR) repeat protein
MSFFESITKKSKLKAAIKQTTEARSSEGSQADQLFAKVYHDYAEVVANELVIAEALYNWGFALLHQAKTKSGEQAIKLYQDAIAKFSFCLTIEPAYLGAAIDGGVAFMELARIKAVKLDDGLYESAKSYFEQANSIQAGSASYNLACIYGLRGEKEACLNALEIAKGKGSLPAAADILADPDLSGIKDQDWFIAFMQAANQKPEINPIVIKEPAADEQTKTDLVLEQIVTELAAVDENSPVKEKSNDEACSAVEDFK